MGRNRKVWEGELGKGNKVFLLRVVPENQLRPMDPHAWVMLERMTAENNMDVQDLEVGFALCCFHVRLASPILERHASLLPQSGGSAAGALAGLSTSRCPF